MQPKNTIRHWAEDDVFSSEIIENQREIVDVTKPAATLIPTGLFNTTKVDRATKAHKR